MMKKLIIRLTIMCCLLLAADRIVAFVLSKFRPVDYKFFVESRTAFFANDKNYDILFIGDSHLADAIDTRIVEKKCKLSAYNLSIYHATPFDNYYFLKYILKNKSQKPKFIVLGTNPAMFRKQMAPSKYIPVILNDFAIRMEMNMNSVSKFDESLILNSVSEKELIKPIMKSLFGIKYKPTRLITKEYNGYLESKNQTPSLEWINYDLSKIRANTKPAQIKYFLKIIDLAKVNGITVLIVNPPIWNKKILAYQKQNRTYSDYQKSIEKIRSSLQVNVFNQGDTILLHQLIQSDYLNPEHLNYFGAQKFTSAFADWFNNNKNFNNK